MLKKGWYVLEVRSGSERKVKEIIKGLVKGKGLENLIGEIKENEIRGYVYIEMTLNNELVYAIEGISNCNGFVRCDGVIVKMN